MRGDGQVRRRWPLVVALLVTVVALAVSGAALLAWQQAEDAADEAEASARAAERRTAQARIDVLESLLRPESLRAFLDVYLETSSTVCSDQQSPLEKLVAEEVAEASEDGEPLAPYKGWELAFDMAGAQDARDGCSPGG